MTEVLIAVCTVVAGAAIARDFADGLNPPQVEGPTRFAKLDVETIARGAQNPAEASARSSCTSVEP